MSTEDITSVEDTNTVDDTVASNESDDTSNEGLDITNEGSNDEPSNDSNDDKVTLEQLDAMSDDEFAAYLDSGKLPSVKANDNADDKKTSPEPKESVKEPTDTDTKEETVPNPNKAKIISKPETPPIDYKATYEAIFKPFKANGKEITPRNIDDVISLMQMGANYTKKMQAMAPLRKIYETLNKANIDAENLNFLIDVNKGDTEAIKKLLQKHKVDPMELDMDKTNYVPNNNIATDDEVEFGNVISEIQDSLPKIQEIMDKTWDAESKKKLLDNKNLLLGLHQEIQMGRFDTIQKQVELEKTFGKYKGVSDIDAYVDLVTKFVQSQQKVQEQSASSTNSRTTKPVPDKSKAAPVRSKTKNQGTTMTPKDLFSMSDEEFEKLSIKDLV